MKNDLDLKPMEDALKNKVKQLDGIYQDLKYEADCLKTQHTLAHKRAEKVRMMKLEVMKLIPFVEEVRKVLETLEEEK